MTGKELYTMVAQMGFAKTLEDNVLYFYRAANLSLARIVRRFPRISVYTLPALGGQHTEVLDLECLTDDFGGFPREVAFLGSEPLREGRDFRIENGRISFTRTLTGEVTVRYLHRPRELTPDNLEEKVDLPAYAESLLPPLVASYLWLDDRGELATHYLSLYHAEAEELARSLNRHGGAHVRSVDGWDRG